MNGRADECESVANLDNIKSSNESAIRTVIEVLNIRDARSSIPIKQLADVTRDTFAIWEEVLGQSNTPIDPRVREISDLQIAWLLAWSQHASFLDEIDQQPSRLPINLWEDYLAYNQKVRTYLQDCNENLKTAISPLVDERIRKTQEIIREMRLGE